MTLVRWRPIQPFHDLELMERGLRRFFEPARFGAATVPATDAYETKDEFVLELEVPGFAEKELEIEVTDHTLVVKGTRTESEEKRERDFLVRERLDDTFERRFQLPETADSARVEATFDKGVLTVHSPKIREATPRKIPIGA